MYGERQQRRVEPEAGRADEGSVFRQGLIGIGWVALVSLVITLIGALLAVLVALGY